MSFAGAGKLRHPSLSFCEVVGTYGPTGNRVIDVGGDISKWIHEQPVHLWKSEYDRSSPVFCDRYVIADELYTLLLLRWSC